MLKALSVQVGTSSLRAQRSNLEENLWIASPLTLLVKTCWNIICTGLNKNRSKHTCTRFLWLGCFLLLGCFLGGCGIKGPLYLPQEKTATAESAPVETAPISASQDTTK
ncbi:MAG: lipoprotein [Burkholderiales bacterium]|jgi:predicted small lipoprotein YifL|nr:lipoprotein [Burkholderiales bacterium]